MVLAEADCVVLPSFYREGALMLRWLLVAVGIDEGITAKCGDSRCRHCERSEAIQRFVILDCRVATLLAMTGIAMTGGLDCRVASHLPRFARS